MTEKTTLWQILVTVRNAGHTSLVLDDVAADHQLRELLGVGLFDTITVQKVGGTDDGSE
jgi:hypothetical protein